MKQLIGAHIGINKGLEKALDKTVEIGANCLQIFSSPPLSYSPPRILKSISHAFSQKAKQFGIKPIFVHSAYLVNIASDNQRIRNLSKVSLIKDLEFCEEISGLGVIFHIGSHKGKGFASALSHLTGNIGEILAKTPRNTKLLLESASGGRGKIGSKLEEIRAILQAIKNVRLGVCLDTAHLFAAGYDFSSPSKVKKLISEISHTIGWDKVKCLHVNDSRADLGSGLDRHENIGQGKIGLQAFKLFLNQAEIKNIPLILETPGFDKKGPDRRNLEILKSLIH